MKILIACECSGIIRNAFRAKGHNAWSCDLKPTEDKSLFHIQGNVIDQLNNQWDMLITHPTCTFLCVSGAKWFDHPSYPTRRQDQEKAAAFFMLFANSRIPKICIENPVGVMSTRYHQPDQIIHPWWFGHNCCKATCLWLKNLPLLVPKIYVHEKGYAPNKLHKLSPGPERSSDRSRTFQGIALAMANQRSLSSSSPLP